MNENLQAEYDRLRADGVDLRELYVQDLNAALKRQMQANVDRTEARLKELGYTGDCKAVAEALVVGVFNEQARQNWMGPVHVLERSEDT